MGVIPAQSGDGGSIRDVGYWILDRGNHREGNRD